METLHTSNYYVMFTGIWALVFSRSLNNVLVRDYQNHTTLILPNHQRSNSPLSSSPFIFQPSKTRTSSKAMALPQQADEDYNLPSEERLSLLQRLQDAFGDGPPHFWAACHLCDTKMLLVLVQVAQISPEAIRVIAGQTRAMVRCCKYLVSCSSLYNS